MWAHLASGGAGSGMRWPARNPHTVTARMLGAYRSMAAFTQLIDWTSFAPASSPSDSVSVSSIPSKPLHCFACRDQDQAVIWLLRDVSAKHRGTMPHRQPVRSVRLELSGMRTGTYRIYVWNTLLATLEEEQSGAVDTQNVLSLTIGRLTDDCAIAIRRVERIADRL